MPPPIVPVAQFNPGAWYGAGSLGLSYGQQTIGRSTVPGAAQGLHWTVIPLPAPQTDDLTMQRRADAVASAYAGLLMDAVDLYRETVCRDGYKAGILKTMSHGFLRLPIMWRGDPEMVAALSDIRDSDTGEITSLGDFTRTHPEHEASVVIEDAIGLGLGLGQYVLMCWRCDSVEWLSEDAPIQLEEQPDGSFASRWIVPRGYDLQKVECCRRCGARRQDRPIGARDLYQLRWRNPRWLWRRLTDGQWFYSGRNGMVAVTPGDGEWLLLQTVPDQDIWIHGPWAMGTKEAIFKRDASYDLQGISATCAPTHVFTAEGNTTPEQREESERQAQGIRFQNMLFLPYPIKHEIHAAQGGDGGYVGTADRISKRTDTEWEVYVTGIQQGTENGEGFANNGVLHRVSRERREFIANECWMRQVWQQGLRFWAADNFGRPCPIGSVDCASPEDKLAAAKADTEEGNAVKALVDGYGAAGFVLTDAYLIERAQAHGIRIQRRAPGAVSRLNLSENAVDAVVMGDEARAQQGLPPFGDERSRQTVAELQNAGKAGGAPAAPPSHPQPASAPPAGAAPPAASPTTDARRPPEDDDPDEDEDDDGDAARLADAMNAHGMAACRHGRTGLCPRCGVRAAYSIDTSAGEPRYRPTWRAIRAPAAA